MAELLALTAAVLFGLVHFGSGLLARRADSFAIALYGQLGGVVLVVASVLVWPAERVSLPDLGWGALSGLGTGIGVAFLYRGLARGQMSVVVPLSDVGAVALPVLVGVALLGDRPSPLAWLGIAAAFPALWLVSRRHATRGRQRGPAAAAGTVDGLVAGLGFAVQFVAISRVDVTVAGLWPVLGARLLAIGTIVTLGRRYGGTLLVPRRLVLPACAVGALGSIAIVCYLLATTHQLLALVTVLAALYPAVPVVLAMTVLHERLTRHQLVGLALAAATIALVSLNGQA